MKKSHFLPSLNKSPITQVFFRICLPLLALSCSFLRADLNNTVFIVAGGQSSDPFYNFTFESNGSVVNFQTYPLRKGNTYTFKGGNISSSHPFTIGSSHNQSSPNVTGGTLDQNSAQNNQSITVTIPADFQGNLAYYCTIHSSMLKQFIIAEPSSGGGEQPEGLPVYQISQNSVDLFVGENVATSGTYAFEIWTDSSSGTAVENKKLVSAVQDANNNWSREEDSTGNILQYDLVAAYDTFEEINVILNGFNAQPSGFIIDSFDEIQGFPIFDLNATTVTQLTNGVATQSGHYAVVDANQTHVDLEPVHEDANGTWTVTPASDYVNLVPSIFADLNATKAWLDANASDPVAVLAFDGNHTDPVDSDFNSTQPSDHNGSTQFAVFDFNSTHLFALTGSESAPEGNYSIIEETDSGGSTYLTAKPMEFINGEWLEDEQGIPYPLVSNFGSMQDVDDWLQTEDLHSVNHTGDSNEPQGLPVYTLTQPQVNSLVGANVATAGTYAVEIWTDSSSGSAVENKKLVSAVQDANNVWSREENSTGLIIEHDLVAAYDTFEEIETFLVSQGFMEAVTQEGTAEVTFQFSEGQPTGFIFDLEEDGNASDSEDDTQGNPGLPVYSFTSDEIEWFTEFANEPAGPYAIWFLDVDAITLEPVEEDDDGNWILTPNEYDYLEFEYAYASISEILSEIDNSTLLGYTDTNSSESNQSIPVYALSQSQIESLTGIANQTSGNFAIWDMGGWTDLEPAILVDNIWALTSDSNDYIEVNSTLFPHIESILNFLGNQSPVGQYHFDQNQTSPDDNNGTNPGDHNGTQGLPVYALNVEQAQTLIDGPAPAGSYAIEIFMEYETNIEQRLLVGAVEIEGEWSRIFDANGDPNEFAIPSAQFPTADHIYQFIDEQGLQPIGYIFEDHDHNGTWPNEEYHGPFDFTIIDEIDLSQTENLVSLATAHQDVWFQQANLADGRYIWALSVENSDENNQSNSGESNMMVDLNGSVYSGDFHAYWRDAFDIETEGNESSGNWREERFATTVEGIENLYLRFPAVRGLNAPKPPIVKTMSNPVVQNNTVFAGGEILSNGNNDDLKLGIEFSSSSRFENPTQLESQNSDEMFEVSFDLSKYQSKYLYYRAYAKNQEFESFGATKRLKVDGLHISFIANAKKLDGGWESSEWFGDYLPNANGWIYHIDLGWCFPVIDSQQNHWLWLEEYGWVWTTPSVWPYLYRNDTSSWIYLLQRKSGPALIFDQTYEHFLPINK